jgi:microsomal dipeptidase-like Zn-dependent dipeptidase
MTVCQGKFSLTTNMLGFHFLIDFNFRMPTYLTDVSDYPYLFAALIQDGWSNDDLIKLANGNLLRVFSAVENVTLDNIKLMKY